MAMSALNPGSKDVLNMIKQSPLEPVNKEQEKCLSFEEVQAISERMDKQIQSKNTKE